MGSLTKKWLLYFTLWVAGGTLTQAGILNQTSSNTYLLGAVLVAVAFMLLSALLWSKYKKSKMHQKVLLEEKEEKIQWLRRVHAENEYHWKKKEQEQELEIQSLTHTVETLETQAKSGSKNQVVSKIEALREQRAARLSQASIASK